MDKKTPTAIRDVAARRRLSEAFRQAGWNLHSPTGVFQGVPGGPTIYLADVDTGRVFTVVSVKDSVAILSRGFDAKELTQQDINNAFGSLIGDIVTGETRFDAETQNMLTILAVLYIAGTKSYAMVRELESPSFLVLRYRDVQLGDNAYLLRPCPLMAQKPLSPADIETLANQVLKLDRQNHPERFPRAKVIPFKVVDNTPVNKL
jgi:hypothetical protein